METKAGYVAIIGKPNAGKSTLLNAILETKLSIVTPKAQTTRKKILGIYTNDNIQTIFLDTPGILEAKHKLHNAMISYIDQAIKDADILLILIDLQKFSDLNSYFKPDFLSNLKKLKKKKIFVLNKTDIFHDKKDLLPIIEEINESQLADEIIPISARRKDGLSHLLSIISSYTPLSEFYYDPDILSIQPERFFVSELIREKIFMLYKYEIPYSTEVVITEFKERDINKWYISADIVIERKSQKIILIGEKGRMIKKLGEIARESIEKHLEHEIYLELFVKVREKWRQKPNMLKSFGY